jgi:tRNA dimethylallyltransferase
MLRPETVIIGINSPPDMLRQQISIRVDSMIDSGLANEVKQLSDLYGWGCEALKGIGYSEWELYFKNLQSLELTKERIIKDTFALARRQQTWFKRNKSIHWFTTPVNITDIDALITTFLNNFISE